MKVITLLNEKGGVGKTTLSTHMAAGLAIRGNRVLLIDSDAQAHTTYHLNQKERGGLFNLLIDGANWQNETTKIDPAIYAGDYKSEGDLYLMPSNIKSRLIPMATNNNELLHDRLDEISSGIDIVIIDTSPTPSMLHSMIYMASDYVLYPTQPEAFGIDGLLKSMKRIPTINKQKLNMGLDKCSILGVQMTMVEQQTSAHQAVIRQAIGNLGGHIWKPIAKRTIVREAQLNKTTLFKYAPEDKATDEVWGMIDRVQAVMYA